jgi:hypothetical protein
MIDLMFCCGGLVWLFFAIHYFVAVPLGNPALIQLLALVGLLSVHALSETHNAATLFRAYRTKETRDRYAGSTKYAALACATLLVAGLLIPGLTPWLARIYVAWVVQHFTAQSYGMTLLYCYKNGFTLGRFEKMSIAALLNCTAAMAIIRQFTYEEWSGNGFLAQILPMPLTLPEWVFGASVLALQFAACTFALMVARRAIIQRQIMPLPAVMLCVTGVMIYLVGRDMAQYLWLYVPAFFHGAQYIVITFAHHVRETGVPEQTAASELWKLTAQPIAIKYFGSLLIASAFIYIGVPRILQEVGFDYGLAFATVFCAVNIHHFITDMAIWKLRDPKLRKALVS